ncbi:MAG: GtrA family protein [Berkelbacteria bacterium GW2011_GWA1_36_9]|uniref:GtrA family protein n=1 Tax=Berkelbacteria bacterium GW2011_GWA1_36_9 TaxID=1618331 RepID=A0A0G0FLN9_9BACT|nr:MAG: GtrA family protein [Berkelbacteria bacterium GW2011_GWA1_36_9]
MKELLKRRVVRQFVKFGLVGLSSATIDWAIYLGLTRFFGFYYIIAKIISFLFAVINSYTWNRRWTFRSTELRRTRQFTKFLVVSGVGLALNTLIMIIVVEKFHLSDIYGLILATGIVTFWNFTINKLWTFKN